MPLNQPTKKFNTENETMTAILFSAPKKCRGTAMKAIVNDASTNPNGKKILALLRSETLPIKNFDSA